MRRNSRPGSGAALASALMSRNSRADDGAEDLRRENHRVRAAHVRHVEILRADVDPGAVGLQDGQIELEPSRRRLEHRAVGPRQLEVFPGRAGPTSPSNSTAPAGVVTLSATTSGRPAGLLRVDGAGAGVHVKMTRRRPSGSTVRPNQESMSGLRLSARIVMSGQDGETRRPQLARERRPVPGSSAHLGVAAARRNLKVVESPVVRARRRERQHIVRIEIPRDSPKRGHQVLTGAERRLRPSGAPGSGAPRTIRLRGVGIGRGGVRRRRRDGLGSNA